MPITPSGPSRQCLEASTTKKSLQNGHSKATLSKDSTKSHQAVYLDLDMLTVTEFADT